MRRSRIVVAAAALLVVTVGVTWWIEQHRVNDVQAQVALAQQQSARLQEVLSAPDARIQIAQREPTARLSAVYSASRRAAWFTFGGLGDAPGGKTYQLWRVGDGSAISLEVLPPGETSGSLLVENVSPNDQIAISVEASSGADRPTMVYATLPL